MCGSFTIGFGYVLKSHLPRAPGEIVREERVVRMPGASHYPVLLPIEGEGGGRGDASQQRPRVHLFFYFLLVQEREGVAGEINK